MSQEKTILTIWCPECKGWVDADWNVCAFCSTDLTSEKTEWITVDEYNERGLD